MLREVKEAAQAQGMVSVDKAVALDRASGVLFSHAHREVMAMSAVLGSPFATASIKWKRADLPNPRPQNEDQHGSDWLYMRVRRLAAIAGVLPQRRATGAEMAEAMRTRSTLVSPPPCAAAA